MDTSTQAPGRPAPVNHKLRISDFRDGVDSLHWNRRDLSGDTRDKFTRMDVRTRLQRHIDIVESLIPHVQARHTGDLEQARSALESARASVDRWAGLQLRIKRGNLWNWLSGRL